MTDDNHNPEQTSARDVGTTNSVRVAAPLADVEQCSATGPVCALLEAIGSDTERAGSKDRPCPIRTSRRSDPTPSVCVPHQITASIRAAAADHFEHRARALIAHGTAEDAAITQAEEEAAQFIHRTVQVARQRRALDELVAAYHSSTYRLLRDLGDHLDASLAYVDRNTVEAHLERDLSDVEWAATHDEFTALEFDDHVGDHGTFRTDWIESILDRAGIPGYDHPAHGDNADSPGAHQPNPDGRQWGTSGGHDLGGHIDSTTRP